MFNLKKVSLVLILCLPLLFLQKKPTVDTTENSRKKIEEIQEEVISQATLGAGWPNEIKIHDQEIKIGYSFSPALQAEVKKILRKYNTDSSSVVIIDMKTGAVLSAVTFDGPAKKFNDISPFISKEPAASLFKIVTASALLESKKLNASTPFYFKGKKTTLYKKQIFTDLHEGKIQTDLTRAFAHSNNPAFAKAALNLISPSLLLTHAKQYGFNVTKWGLGLFPNALASNPENDYEFAELASGFNTSTVITPVQAALLAGIIANDGVAVPARVVGQFQDEEGVFDASDINIGNTHKIIDSVAVKGLSTMMRATLVMGTASKPFRSLLRKYSHKYQFGGKTGSITGKNPVGKREWFAGYVKGNTPDSSRYAVSVLNIYKKKWYIKASHLAAEIVESLIRHDQNKVNKLAKY
jgi:peptidoglycan glycosyltransferase